MFGKIALAALVALLPAAALADPPATRPGSSTRQTDPNRRVCRVIGDTAWRTGSGRVCKTQAEWDRIARQNADDYDRVIGQPTITLNDPNATVRDGPVVGGPRK
jgi:hypothetical protein